MLPANKATMQSLKMANDLMPGILAGTKRITIRKGRRNIVPGPMLIESVDGRTKHTVQVIEVRHKLLKEVTKYEAEDDGFNSLLDMVDGMREFYPDLTANSEVTLVLW